MDQERSSEFEGDRRVFDALVDYTRDLVGSLGAFDLGYGEDDMARAQNIIASTVTGRVRERSAFGRSGVTIDGVIIPQVAGGRLSGALTW